MYDPTIARWLSTDPYDEFATPYVGIGADPVNNVDPDGGGEFSAVFKEMLRVFNHSVPRVGQFSGTAQGTSLTTSNSSASSGGSSLSGAAANAVGNLAAYFLGQWVANKLFPLPSGPDAGQLQQPQGQIAKQIQTQSDLRKVTVTVTSQTVGTARTFSYPVSNSNDPCPGACPHAPEWLYSVPLAL